MVKRLVYTLIVCLAAIACGMLLSNLGNGQNSDLFGYLIHNPLTDVLELGQVMGEEYARMENAGLYPLLLIVLVELLLSKFVLPLIDEMYFSDCPAPLLIGTRFVIECTLFMLLFHIAISLTARFGPALLDMLTLINRAESPWDVVKYIVFMCFFWVLTVIPCIVMIRRLLVLLGGVLIVCVLDMILPLELFTLLQFNFIVMFIFYEATIWIADRWIES